MHTLVVYDSQFGNTERVAMAIADALREFGQAQAIQVDAAHPALLREIDLLVLGSPTQRWQPTPAMRACPERIAAGDLPERLAVACFDTRFRKPRWMTGSAAKRMADQLREVHVKLLLPPESFFVADSDGPLEQGEVARAAQWALLLHERYEATLPRLVTH